MRESISLGGRYRYFKRSIDLLVSFATIIILFVSIVSPPYTIASNAQSCAQTPHPVQSVASMVAFPSLKEREGHPRPIQRRQERHLAGSTARAGLAFTVFNSTQGLREMITEGSSAASSSFSTLSQAFRS